MIVISQYCRAIIKGFSEVCPCPVEDGHEIVADHLDAGFRSIAQGRNVVFDIFIAARQAQFNVFVDVDAFQIFEDEVILFCFFFDVEQRFYRPYFTDRNIEQGTDDAVHPRNLVDLLQGNFVIFFSVPTEGHSHKAILQL